MSDGIDMGRSLSPDPQANWGGDLGERSDRWLRADKGDPPLPAVLEALDPGDLPRSVEGVPGVVGAVAFGLGLQILRRHWPHAGQGFLDPHCGQCDFARGVGVTLIALGFV